MDTPEQTTAQATPVAGTAEARAKEAMHGLEAYLAPIFEKFPHLPEGGRKFIVDISPYIALVFGVLGVIGLLGASGMGMFMLLATFGMALPLMIHIVLGLVSAVLLLLAFTGLKAHTKKGWNFVFYSQVVSIAGGVVGLATGMGGLVGTIIGALIGFYILFEIRTYYK